VRIPRAFALDTQLEHNSIVEISLVDDQIVVKPVSSRQWSLEQLLSEVTSENIHQEIETGDAVGDEVW
jgi:antitoxin MazE